MNKRNPQKMLSVRDGLLNHKNCVILVLASNRKQKIHPDFTHDSTGFFYLSYFFISQQLHIFVHYRLFQTLSDLTNMSH